MAGHVKIVHPRRRKRLRRKVAIRKKLHGTAERPRLSVFRSSKHIYAQVIDDGKGTTLAAASSVEPDLRKKLKPGTGHRTTGALPAAILQIAATSSAGPAHVCPAPPSSEPGNWSPMRESPPAAVARGR